jgi:hypothetical protein
MRSHSGSRTRGTAILMLRVIAAMVAAGKAVVKNASAPCHSSDGEHLMDIQPIWLIFWFAPTRSKAQRNGSGTVRCRREMMPVGGRKEVPGATLGRKLDGE